jgi:hypothetical protein
LRYPLDKPSGQVAGLAKKKTRSAWHNSRNDRRIENLHVSGRTTYRVARFQNTRVDTQGQILMSFEARPAGSKQSESSKTALPQCWQNFIRSRCEREATLGVHRGDNTTVMRYFLPRPKMELAQRATTLGPRQIENEPQLAKQHASPSLPGKSQPEKIRSDHTLWLSRASTTISGHLVGPKTIPSRHMPKEDGLIGNMECEASKYEWGANMEE